VEVLRLTSVMMMSLRVYVKITRKSYWQQTCSIFEHKLSNLFSINVINGENIQLLKVGAECQVEWTCEMCLTALF